MTKTPWYKTDSFLIWMALIATLMMFVAMASIIGIRPMLEAMAVAVVFSIGVGVFLTYMSKRIAREEKEWDTVLEVPAPGHRYQVHKSTGKRRVSPSRGVVPPINRDWLSGKTDDI